MSPTNTFTFCLDNYPNKSKEAMWKDIASFLQIAQKNENVCVIRTEIPEEMIVIKYDHDENLEDEVWGIENPQWITEDEWQMILNIRNNTEAKDKCE